MLFIIFIPSFSVNKREIIQYKNLFLTAVSHIQNFGDLQNLSPQLRHFLGRDVGAGSGMCISKGDDTSPVANDHVSRREMS